MGQQKPICRFLRDRAARGNAAAQFHLGKHYEERLDLEANDAKAGEWFLKSAEAGYVPAMVSLGKAILYGNGFERSRVRAVFWFLKAANSGSVEACNMLGWFYCNRTGLKNPGPNAYKWFRTGAARGCPDCMSDLAFCFRRGVGTQPSRVWEFVCVRVSQVLTRSVPYRRSWLEERLTDGEVTMVLDLSQNILRSRVFEFGDDCGDAGSRKAS